ncbi:3'-5' RNA exonuclease complex component [Coemansia sp. RSA 1933]|nr:3'-5' RNA exonuclease complex component [Coemansia sp. RSA 1933]
MTSMDKVLDIIDRDDSSAKKTEDSADGIKGSGKSSSDPDNDDEFGSILGELGEKNSAELAEDREFEELIRRSWKLYDEDMEFNAKPSTERHVSEVNSANNIEVMPITASVSTGDFVELRFPKEGSSAITSMSDIRPAIVIQKTSGRFQFNIITGNYLVAGARVQRVGFVSSGILFNDKYLQSAGIKSDDIARLREYREQLVEFRNAHGREAVVSEHTATQFMSRASKKFALESAATEANEMIDISVDAVSENIELGLSGQHDEFSQSGETEAEDGSEEPFSDFIFRVGPTLVRSFKEEADALLLSHYRELKGYYDIAVRNGQKHVTVDGLARLIFSKKNDSPDKPVDEAARFAAYMHMINDTLHFIPDVHVFYTNRFELRDPDEVREITVSKDMVRRRSPEFMAFVETAQKLVSYSYDRNPAIPSRTSLDADIDAIRRSTSCDLSGWKHDMFLHDRVIPCNPAPTKTEVGAIQFDDTSRLFIKSLVKYVFYKTEGYANVTNPYEFIMAPVLKKMGVYGRLDVAAVSRFLIDIGVWPSWFNPSSITRDYQPGDYADGTARKRLSDVGEKISDQFLENAAALSTGKKGDVKAMPSIDSVSDLVPPVVDNILTKTSDGKGVLKASEFYDRDLCAAIRYDFGSLPVYTIDSEETRDVDDGVSLETVKGADGKDKTWLHIHIADPTALIHPGHVLAELSKLGGQSVYTPELVSNMLPNDLIETSISVSSHSNGIPTYTLTISVVLGDDGDIAEYKIRPSVVHNPVPVPYSAVDQYMRFDPDTCIYSSNEDVQVQQRLATIVHPFTAEDYDAFNIATATKSLPKQTVSDLRQIQEVVMRHHAYRIRQGSFTRVLPDQQVAISDPANVVQPRSAISRKPAFLSSKFMAHAYDEKVYPKLTSVSFTKAYTPAHILVSELMILAGRVSARFCHDHGSGADDGAMTSNSNGVITSTTSIPALFRSQDVPDLDSLSGITPGLPVPFEGMSSKDAESSHAVWAAVMKMSRKQGGIVDIRYFDEVRHMLNPSVIQDTPGPHTIMGIFDKHGYMRSTSPLRRVEDIVNHWQIKAQILAEHTNAKDKMPWYWKRDDIKTLAPKTYYALLASSKFSFLSTDFWGHALMRRMEWLARRGKLEHPTPGFYDVNSPHYQDTPWAYLNPRNPGPLIWTALVDNRSEFRPFISLVIKGLATRAMLVPRPVHVNDLPFAGTKIRVQVVGSDPIKQMLIVKLAPEEFQPPETPKFWKKLCAVNFLPNHISQLTTPP